MQLLAEPTHIDAIQILPESNFSVTVKNLYGSLLTALLNSPFSLTSVNLLSMLTLGILTFLKKRAALSTPFYPILTPISIMVTPGTSFMFSSLILIRNGDTPSFLPFTIHCPKRTAWFECLNPLVIQYF